jgi:hypothetical protein
MFHALAERRSVRYSAVFNLKEPVRVP